VIHWRFGGWNDAGLPPRARAEAWLCADERERFLAFKVEKRREDWLIGRVNAKALVADAVAYRYGVRLDGSAIHIARQPSGAPAVRLVGGARSAGTLPDALPMTLSNSHSNGHALCALTWVDGFENRRPLAAVGADLEWVEPRSDGFVADFLTPPERAWWAAAENDRRHERANLVWSAKEAVLKVVQRGLSVDTYWVTCVPAEDSENDWLAAMLTPVDGEWEPLAVSCDGRFPTHGLGFHVVWREIRGFVATIAVGYRA
jgi:4'-phosphopantetheinyl transferase